MSYEEKFIGFIDILGFKELVKKPSLPRDVLFPASRCNSCYNYYIGGLLLWIVILTNKTLR